MEQELKEKNLILEALILHRMKLPNDEQSELRDELIKNLSMEISDLQFELNREL